MARLQFTAFQGMAPKLPPYNMQEGMGQRVEGCDLSVPVMLRPLPGLREVRDLPENTEGDLVRTLYLFAPGDDELEVQYWFTSTERVEFVRGPLPEDDQLRTYFTDPHYPKVTRRDVALGEDPLPAFSYRLGVKPPSTAPEVTNVSGTVDDDLLAYTTAYVQTFVTGWGEEGPPSEASELVDAKPGQGVELSLAAMPDDDDANIQESRLYRLNTGSSSTEFQLVATFSNSVPATYTDTMASRQLGEVLPTEDWTPPPDEGHPTGPLRGLVGLSNGSLAGFTGETICLSTPYVPSSWPFESRYTIKDRIIGLSNSPRGLLVLTDHAPQVGMGNSPYAMSFQQLTGNYACVSPESIVDMGGMTLYASREGLIACDGSQAQLITEGLFDQAQWQSMYRSESIHAYYWNDKYVAFFDNGERKGGFIFDPRDQVSAFTELGFYAHAGHYVSQENRLYLAVDNVLYEFAAPNGDATLLLDVNEATWPQLEETMHGIGDSLAQEIVYVRDEQGGFRSIYDMAQVSGVSEGTVRQNEHLISVGVGPGRRALHRSAIKNTPTPVSMSALRVLAKGKGEVAVFGDNHLLGSFSYDAQESGYQFFRLPAGCRAREWAVEARVEDELYQIDLATSKMELRDG